MAMTDKAEDNAYRIGSLDSKETQVFAPAQTMLTYVPQGYLLFVRDKTLVAQPFDAGKLKTTGEPVPLAEQIGTDGVGLARFSVSRDGVLVYRTGDSGNRMVWMDRSGKEIDNVGEVGDHGDPAFSPGGDRLAFDLNDPRNGKSDIWVRELIRGVNSRATFGSGDNISPLWSPDGSRIVFSSNRNGTFDLFEKSASGQGDEKLLLKSDEFKFACDWSRDGSYILYSSQGKTTNWDIWALPTSGDGKPIPLVVGPFIEIKPRLSVDGKFISYNSNESGRSEIYVRTFPGGDGKWQVSNAGGSDAEWSADGRELFYRAPDQKLMAVEVQTANGFQAGIPQALFAGRTLSGPARNKYLAAQDGKRFLYVSPLGRDAMTPTTVVLNWFAALEK
jgi:Tol biopolymer transport system component